MKRFKSSVRQWWPYYLMMAPALIFFFIFHYMPVWEAKIAFEQLRIIPPNIWVGLKHFELLFSSTIFWQVLANTLIISAMKIVFVFPVPIIVALLLNEVRGTGTRKFIQSAIYLPHFLSWVVIAGIFIAVLSPSTGAVNEITGFFGFQPVSFMTETGTIRWVLVFSEIWRSAGWDSLLYLAAIMSIDQELYQAAEIDGANRWQKIFYVTIPGIVPTIATLFILNAGMFLNADLNQVINFTNDIVRSQIDILDTYVYRIGLQTGQYSLATAAGLFKAGLGMILIMSAHFISKKLTGKGIW
ncbi:sugar ABC transporter permease (plasmid) [Pseudochrobactrum algeriensis]|uniref:ABC transporter permease n=1 Tax=Pseudochrobactrum TaxID=354349 RepID=UPI001BD35651|nr:MULTISPECIES: ABC transporter permease subunit [Pseudochrobactrum]MBX8812664.1 sugar ABC transporter permease [Ochrobactrum sp. MR34]QVQ35365.1 sugar ABC transporter permease [Pseudochrobactrum algeriensis]QVQ41980.1 sugar ABC transporter permease [Pseudochrobactrum algeriensis]QVQ42595.1 sugar ABC transporter permease [Pseudochrobactrum algeriensis]UCA47483.1 ABC transporter permease subunit [Pseudochrobactrum sp. XF203]